MKCIFIIIFATVGLKANAQTITCITQKGSGNNKDMVIALANITPPINNLPQQFGFIKRGDKPIFNFRCVDTQDSLPNLKGVNLVKSTIVVKLDNDSLIYFHPNGGLSNIQYGQKSLVIYIEADVTNDQLNNFKNHKLVSLRLITDTFKRYGIFIFTDQNKIDIQNATDCFIGKNH